MSRIFLGVLMSSFVGICGVLPKYHSMVLDNGLGVFVIPIKNNTRVIQTNVFYRVGSRNEVMGKSGIAHMLEHMNFKSTKNLKAGEFDNIVKRMGGVDNALTSFDYTQYYIRTSSKNLGKSMELFSELMKNLSLKNDEFLPERDVVMQERLWRTDNSPEGYLFFRFYNTAFIYHPYHWTPIGFVDDINNWTLKDIEDFHNIYYQPCNAFVLVSGDVDPQLVFDHAKRHFSDIKNKGPIPSVHMQEPKQDGSRVVYVNKDTGGIDLLAIGFRTSNFRDEDHVALDAISEILGGSKSSILNSLLVDKLKLSSSVEVYNGGMVDDGVFLILISANPGVKASDINDVVLREIENLKRGEITQKDLDKVKIQAKSSLVSSLEDSGSVSRLFGSYLAMGDVKPLLNLESGLEKLTVKDIQRVASKYLTTENSTTLYMSKK